MSEQALAFGLMGLFLFIMALAVSGLQVGTCPECDHCRDLRRRQEENRRAVEYKLAEHSRGRADRRPGEVARRDARLREQPERTGERTASRSDSEHTDR